MLEEAGRAEDYVEIGPEGSWQWNPSTIPARPLLARLHRLLAHQPALRQEPRADLDERAVAGTIGPLDQMAFLRPLHRVMYVPLNDYHPDPGVSLGPLPGLAAARILAEEEAGSDRRGFALPVLVRERNRLIEAVDEAFLVGGSLKEELGR